METKTFCSNCKAPCYSPKMKEKIKQIMKFSGPRMLFHHPLLVISHMLSNPSPSISRPVGVSR